MASNFDIARQLIAIAKQIATAGPLDDLFEDVSVEEPESTGPISLDAPSKKPIYQPGRSVQRLPPPVLSPKEEREAQRRVDEKLAEDKLRAKHKREMTEEMKKKKAEESRRIMNEPALKPDTRGRLTQDWRPDAIYFIANPAKDVFRIFFGTNIKEIAENMIRALPPEMENWGFRLYDARDIRRWGMDPNKKEQWLHVNDPSPAAMIPAPIPSGDTDPELQLQKGLEKFIPERNDPEFTEYLMTRLYDEPQILMGFKSSLDRIEAMKQPFVRMVKEATKAVVKTSEDVFNDPNWFVDPTNPKVWLSRNDVRLILKRKAN